jgi:hypothetical protein
MTEMINIIRMHFLPEFSWVHLCDISGKNEQAVMGTRSVDAIRLLDSLLSNGSGTKNSELNTAKLSIYDRDRVLATLYMNTYGPRVETTVECPGCHQSYDIGFPLQELMNDPTQTGSTRQVIVNDSFRFITASGVTFRLPTGEDELAMTGIAPEKAEAGLLERCILENKDLATADTVQKVMEEVAPMVAGSFDVTCPECNFMQQLNFNLQYYLLASLLAERKKLVAEIHLLSRYYGWGLNEILELPRSMRKAFAKRLETNV